MEFPGALRQHRTSRHLSQLDLAIRAGSTQRQVSFLETARSEPGPELVIRLAEALELPLRERNALLLAAGFAPAYPQTPLTDPALAPVRLALEHVLAAYRPYPAIVVDRRGDLVAANEAVGLLTEGVPEELIEPPVNAYRLALHPRGLAHRVVNFGQWGRHVLDALQIQVLRDPDDQLSALLAELRTYVPDQPAEPGNLAIAVPLRLRTAEGGELDLMTTITRFATAADVTISELRLAAFMPASQFTAEYLRARGE